MEVSDMFRLWEAMGSRFSTRGEARRSITLDGDPTLKGFETAERGVGNAALAFGERRASIALSGVTPPELMDPGVISCVLLDLELRISGAGEPLRSVAGDLGGTSGGLSRPSSALVVSTFNAGLGLTLGLRMGDKGFPTGAEASSFVIGIFVELRETPSSDCIYEGPVTQDIRASPKGPALQLVPGALLDLSWPKTSVEALRRGGRPGMVANFVQYLRNRGRREENTYVSQ